MEISIVSVIILIILASLFVLVWRLDSRVSRMEKQQSDQDKINE